MRCSDVVIMFGNTKRHLGEVTVSKDSAHVGFYKVVDERATLIVNGRYIVYFDPIVPERSDRPSITMI